MTRFKYSLLFAALLPVYAQADVSVSDDPKPQESTELPTITVTADRTASSNDGYTVSGTHTPFGLPMTLREIPQSVSVITSQQMRDQNIKTLDRALARTHAVGHTAPVQLADDRAGKLLRQAGMGNRHRKRTKHRIRKRNLRAAFQTFVEHGDNPRLTDLSRRIGNVLQRHTRHRAADKRADRQAQYHVHARQRQHQHNDYGNYDCIHCLSLQTYKCLHIETHHNPITENPPILQTIISNASYTSPA